MVRYTALVPKRFNKLFQAGHLFGVTSAGANAALAKGDIGVRRDQAVGDLNAGRQRDFDLFEANRSADTKKWFGDKLIAGSTYTADTIRGVTKGRGSTAETLGEGGAALVEIGGGAAGLYEQYRSIQDRAAGQKSAVNSSTNKIVGNQERAGAGFSTNQDTYVKQMTEIHQRYAQDQIAAIRGGANQAAGGATRGTSITMSGINRGASIEMRANKMIADGSVAAASQVRDAALQATSLHMASSINQSGQAPCRPPNRTRDDTAVLAAEIAVVAGAVQAELNSIHVVLNTQHSGFR